MRLVFLAFLQRAFGGVEVGARGEALHRLARQVAVGHGVADYRHAAASRLEQAGEVARRLRLAAAGAYRRDGNDRHAGLDLRAGGSEQDEVGARRQRPGGEMHDLRVRYVAVGEDHCVNAVLVAEKVEIRFVADGDALGVARPGQFRRIAAVGDAGDLRRGEGHHLDGGIVAVDQVEVVEVAPCRAEDEDASTHAYLRNSRSALRKAIFSATSFGSSASQSR